MTAIRSILALAVVVVAAPLPALADEGLTMAGGLSLGVNADDQAIDFEGSHPYLMLQTGWRFSTGTEPYLAAGMGLGGHESVLAHYGAGIRQRLTFDRLEPYAEAGLFFVGDEAGTPLALSLGLGVSYRLGEHTSVGVGGGHFFSADSDDQGALDWYAQSYLTWTLD